MPGSALRKSSLPYAGQSPGIQDQVRVSNRHPNSRACVEELPQGWGASLYFVGDSTCVSRVSYQG